MLVALLVSITDDTVIATNVVLIYTTNIALFLTTNRMETFVKIAVVNQKGGVGKTTVSVNLAYGLSQIGKRVLLVDMDMQAHSSVIYSPDLPSTPDGTIAEALRDRQCNIRSIVRPARVHGTELANLDLIPSNIHLGIVAEQIASRHYREKILHNQLKTLEQEYDYVVIDCPPAVGVVAVNALYTADLVLIPTNYSRYALDGIADLFHTIREVKEGNEECYLILRNAFDSRTSSTNAYIDEQLKPFSTRILKTMIRKTESINQAQIEGVPVQVFDPKSNGATDFLTLTNEISHYGR